MKTWFLAVPLFVVACSGASHQAPSASAPLAVQAILGTAGGTLVAADGSQISIPPGALLGDTIISMTPEPAPSATGIGQPAGQAWLLGPEGQQFLSPVTVTLAIDPQALASHETPDDVLVYTSPQANPDFTAMATAPADGTHVSVQTSHFSHFAPRHETKMFGLGVDAPTAIGNSVLFTELKSDWKSKQGHTLQTARIVFGIDGVDANTDNQSYKLLAEANAEPVTAPSSEPSWVRDAAKGLSGLQTWVTGVKAGKLLPAVAIAVTRFDTCREDSATANLKSCPKHKKSQYTSLSHSNFRDRFRWLLENYPDVTAWGLINEPEDTGFEPKDVVDYYVDGAKVLDELQHAGKAKGVTLFFGEFCVISTKNWTAVGDELIKAVKANDVSFPHVWGLHPYGDTTGSHTKSGSVEFDTHATSTYVDFIEGLEKKANLAHDTLRVWLTESGTMLEGGIWGCNADSRDNKAQYEGGRQIYALAAKSRVDRVYWWQFEQGACDWGGDWDSGLVDWNGQPRPAFYALVGKPDSYPGVSVARDCGGPGKNNCPVSQCCVLCSEQAQTYSTYDQTSSIAPASCASAAQTFCAANQDRGSVQNATTGWCAPLPAPTPPPSCGTLAPGQSLSSVRVGEVASCNRGYWLTLGETDGKLGETKLDVGVIWDEVGQLGDHLDMQADGNLVLYASGGSVLWASNTSGNPGAYLDLQDDGSLIITLGATPVCSLKGALGPIAACP